jgi:DNA modification methylase
MTDVKLMLGNCLDRLKDLDDNSVDSIVTDPPYGIDFMGKKWDYDVPSTEIWEQALRVLKPGGYLLAFAGTRTQHRMAVRIEDAGFEIRDMIAWVYGSGFPKSHNISKSLDKMVGAEREVISEKKTNSGGMAHISKTNAEHGFRPNAYTGNSDDKTAQNVIQVTAPATDEAKKWDGWGTALKPALEPITVARKPLEEKTVAANVLKYGTGGINIDASRIPTNPDVDDARLGGNGSWKTDKASANVGHGSIKGDNISSSEQGRFPANLIHDGSEEVTELFPNSKSCSSPSKAKPEGTIFGGARTQGAIYPGDNGSAARFFYVPKTSKKDRNDGLDNFIPKATASSEFRPNHAEKADNGEDGNPYGRWTPTQNNHPTVKPTDLMRYLVTMVTPKGGTTLDPFMGSGSTGRGAKLGGFNFIGIELDPDYLEIAKARIDAIVEESTLDEFFT